MGQMARLLLVGLVALCVASTKAAVIPVEELVDGLQSFLTAPEESGLRLKRSTGEWDKEFDLSSMGILFQLKYTNPANPFEGGRAHVKVPGARFVRNAPFDDMELDIEFNGGSAIDGLFDMKVDYKFIQKFMFLADRPQEGSFVLYRKMEGGMWKTRVTVDNNNMMPKPFLDIAVESDRKTKLHVLFNFEEDNKWELKVDRVPGQKMTIEAVVNGQKWTGVGTLNQGDMKLNLKMDSEFTGKHFNVDFDLNPAGMWGMHVTGNVDGPVDAKWTMQQDWTMGEIVMKYKNQNYAFMQLKGNAEMRGMFPVMVLVLHDDLSHGPVLLHGPLGIHRAIDISGDMETPHTCRVQVEVEVVVLSGELGVNLQVQLHVALVEGSDSSPLLSVNDSLD